jgi:uncharacterized protein
VQKGVAGEDSIGDDSFITWVENILALRNPERFHLTFFGGEPLLRKDSIYRIATQLHRRCEESSIEFVFSVTTNGTLLEADDLKAWNPIGLSSVDVTLDGTKETHDGRRRYRGGEGTFDDIVGRLIDIRGITAINLISNISSSDSEYADFLSLLADLHAKIGFNSLRFKPFYNNELQHSCVFNSANIEATKRLWAESEWLGLPVERNFVIGPCGFFSNNTMAVTPQGSIYPCTPFFGQERFLLGNISYSTLLEKWFRLPDNLPHKCLDCAYVPVCCGGCRFVSSRHHGDASKVACEKPFFDSIFAPL